MEFGERIRNKLNRNEIALSTRHVARGVVEFDSPSRIIKISGKNKNPCMNLDAVVGQTPYLLSTFFYR